MAPRTACALFGIRSDRAGGSAEQLSRTRGRIKHVVGGINAVVRLDQLA
jgi:hypothetical protein